MCGLGLFVMSSKQTWGFRGGGSFNPLVVRAKSPIFKRKTKTHQIRDSKNAK